MDKAAAPFETKKNNLVRNLLLLLPALILFIALTSIRLWRAYEGSLPELQSNGVPISPEIEEKFGVRFTGIHILAKGGLVDLRYRIIDIGKAKNFGHYTETSPMLVDEKTGKTVEVTIMGLHNHRVESGREYYILYRNTANALKPGSKVTLQIGNYRLENIPVQ